MTGPEAVFRSWLLTDKKRPEWFMQAIETNTAIGVPDVFFCVDGMSGWIELKATKTKHCFMRISQYNWLRKYHKQKGLGLLLIKRLTAPQCVDIYNTADLVSMPNDRCRISGKDIVFPSTVKPKATYKFGSGIRGLYDLMYAICKVYETIR